MKCKKYLPYLSQYVHKTNLGLACVKKKAVVHETKMEK